MMCVILTSQVLGGWEPWVGIRELESKSVAIIAGSVLEVQRVQLVGTGADGSREFRITTTMSSDVVIKGDVAESVLAIENVCSDSDDDPRPTINLQKGEQFVAFLSSKAGKYSFTSVWRPGFRVSGSAIAKYKGSKCDLQNLLVLSLDENDRACAKDAMIALQDMGSRSHLQRIDALSKCDDPVIRGYALAACLKQGMAAHLRDAMGYIDQIPDTEENTRAKAEIIMSIDRVTDKTSLPDLHKLLSHSRPEVRRSIALSIRNIESSESIPHLITALDDSDDSVRWICLSALESILGPRETDEESVVYTRQEYSAALKAWKTWWQTEDAAKYKAAQ
jgi:hypothetical protein